MSNLLKKYEEELKERVTQSEELGDEENSFVNGIITQLKSTISDLKNQSLKDRFFLEEIVYKIQQNQSDHYETLTRDFLSEYVSNIPMSESERTDYIKNVLGFEDMDYYFKSEKELYFYLKNNRIPKDEDIDFLDYSIQDVTTHSYNV